jgi:hypothetical protein
VLSLERRARECTGLLPGASLPENRVEVAGEEVLGVAPLRSSGPPANAAEAGVHAGR